MVYLALPQTKGAEILYAKYVAPWLSKWVEMYERASDMDCWCIYNTILSCVTKILDIFVQHVTE